MRAVLKLKIVITDAQTITNGDIKLDNIGLLGDMTVYNLTSPQETAQRIKDADAVICNKTLLNKENLSGARNLKYIGLFATGYNNIDLPYCREKGITVCNAGSYSTNAVAQHTFAFILNHYNKIAQYNSFVQNGGWLSSTTFSPFVYPLNELYQKTIGIVGYGSIGKAVVKIADALGMRILINSRTPKKPLYGEFVDFPTLISQSDIVTVHCPLNAQSERMFCAREFEAMKDGAFFINTARGGVMDEQDLADALKSGKLSGAAIDVLDEEPMSRDCRLLNVPNCTITPHIAWAPYETRLRLLEIVYGNLKAFTEGSPTNVV